MVLVVIATVWDRGFPPFARLKRDTRKAQSIDLTGRNILSMQEEKAVNSGWFNEAWGRFTYQYFNWRKASSPLSVSAKYPSVTTLPL